MRWIIMILTNILCLLVVTAYEMKLGYQIKDGNVIYEKELETNREMNVLKIHILAHNEVMESYSMQDFQKGQQITCIPSLHQCRFREIKTENNAGASLIMETFIQSLFNKGYSKPEAHTTIGRELFHMDKNEMVDQYILEEDLREFYHGFGFPLYKEKKILNDAKIFNITRFKAGRRVKRSFTRLEVDCYGQYPTVKYGVISGTSSNRIKICNGAARINGQMVFPDCDNVSITSSLVRMCVCCPYVTYIDLTRDDCACTEMGF
ncbi:uncharacterized protein LOC127732853 [Mytilus californianus]|uniref:uncharacterized protein LOC127732853 n=1 Tax=Mytilus californianus TaxID=6549 RepID=UPI002246D597|nr:uncharacterized protein LOC127732853 [Mytilus californianus]